MKKKKIVIVTIIVIGVLVLSFFIGAGFNRRTDVVLTEYSVSEDGKKLTFQCRGHVVYGIYKRFS